MDWDKLDYHRESDTVSEQWLIDTWLSKKELEYITHLPKEGSENEEPYVSKWRGIKRRPIDVIITQNH